MIGERIKQQRQALGLSQKALAELAGIAQQTIHSLESGRTHSTKALVKLAQVLQTTPDWLDSGDGIADANPPYGHPVLSQIAIVGNNTDGYQPEWLAQGCPSQWPGQQLQTPSFDPSSHALRITDNAYEPRLLAGEVISVSQQIACCEGEDVVIVELDQRLRICQLVSQREHEITVLTLGAKPQRKIVPRSRIQYLFAVTGIYPGSLII